jgi:adenylyltransferase/sulfurtransferase
LKSWEERPSRNLHHDRDLIENTLTIPSLTPEQLKAEIDSGRSLVLLDVREPDELKISVLDGVINIPMAEIPSRLAEVDPSAEIVVICHLGMRSARVVQFLLGQGYQNVRNLADGMNGWAERVDPSLPVY